MKYTKLLLFAIAVFLLGGVSGQQNKQGTITGLIRDSQTKSPLTEAVITLSSTAFTGQKFALTDSAGMYKINNLPAGNYTIAFEMEGYKKFVHDSVTIQDGTSVGISYHMVKEFNRNKKNTVQATSYR